MAEHVLVFDARPLDHIIALGSGISLRVYAVGQSQQPGDYRVEHVCKRWADDHEPDGEFVKIVAPLLNLNHVVTWGEGVTIRASIACPDCGLHGFVTDSVWSAA